MTDPDSPWWSPDTAALRRRAPFGEADRRVRAALAATDAVVAAAARRAASTNARSAEVPESFRR